MSRIISPSAGPRANNATVLLVAVDTTHGISVVYATVPSLTLDPHGDGVGPLSRFYYAPTNGEWTETHGYTHLEAITEIRALIDDGWEAKSPT